MNLVTRCVVCFFGCCLMHFSFAETTFSNPHPNWLIRVQQNCPPADALPPGSYSESCYNCKMEGCGWLTCECDHSHHKTGIDTKTCPANTFWNEHGNLRCGNG